jgi:transposase
MGVNMSKAKKVIRKQLRPVRVFSEEFKKKIVADIESSLLRVCTVVREQGVSESAVYKWINKYSRHLRSGHKLVVEMESEAYKTQQLQQRIAELERIVGQKQILLDFYEKMMELAGQELGVDLKKNFFTPPSTGSTTTGSSTAMPSATSMKP